MISFLVISKTPGSEVAGDQVPHPDLHRLAWRRQASQHRLSIFAPEGSSVPLLSRSDGKVLVVGEIFPTLGGPSIRSILQRTCGAAPVETAAQLMRDAWGRYILLTIGVDGALESVARDPSGALCCALWKTRSEWVVTSVPHRVLPALRPVHWGIDWDTISEQVADPSAIASGSSLVGVETITPGGWRSVADNGRRQIWTPASAARAQISDMDGARLALAGAVDETVARLSAGRAVAAEVSGGLDSSIVAAGLVKAQADVRLWLNASPEEDEGNEQNFARDLTDRFGVDLTVLALPPLKLDLEAIAANQREIAPSISDFDPDVERAMLDRCAIAGARAIFTGRGGDAVFWVAPTTTVMADRLHRLGPLGLLGHVLPNTARWSRQSVFATVRSAIAALQNPPNFPQPTPVWIEKSVRRPQHAWLQDLDGVAPTKRVQIAALVHMQSTLGLTHRTLEIDVINPLLSQPVMEVCARIPIDVLVAEGRDRSLARNAYANRLPARVLARRSKGDMSRRFSSALTAGLPAVRGYLLGGRLVAERVIDGARLDQALDEDNLARLGDTLSIYRALAVEAWVRHWEPICASAPDGA